MDVPGIPAEANGADRTETEGIVAQVARTGHVVGHRLTALAPRRLFQAASWSDHQLDALAQHLNGITILTGGAADGPAASRRSTRKPDDACFYRNLSQLAARLPLGAEVRLIDQAKYFANGAGRAGASQPSGAAGEVEARATAWIHLDAVRGPNGLDWARLAEAAADLVERAAPFARNARAFRPSATDANWPIRPVVAIALRGGPAGCDPFGMTQRLKTDIFQFIRRQILDSLFTNGSLHGHHADQPAPIFELVWDDGPDGCDNHGSAPLPGLATPYRILAGPRPMSLSQMAFAIAPGEDGATLRRLDRMGCASGADARRFFLSAPATPSHGPVRTGRPTPLAGHKASLLPTDLLALDGPSGAGYRDAYQACAFLMSDPFRRGAPSAHSARMSPVPCDRCGHVVAAVAGTLHCRRCGALLVGA